MFVGPDQYTTTLECMVADEPALDVAVAFWGQGADRRIHPNESKPIRVICNLRSGGSNPWAIQSLLTRAETYPHVQVRQCDRLHAKVLIGASQALIGSANISANGLGLEGSEAAHWLEAGFHTNNLAEIASSQRWFDQLWSSMDARDITVEDMANAIEAYKRNQSSRPDYSPPGPFSFNKYRPEQLQGRDAYALIYVSRPSEEAEAATLGHLKAEAIAAGADEVKGKGASRWTFECWPESLDTSEKNEYLCLLWKAKTGSVTVDGPCKMTSTQLEFQYSGERHWGWVDLARPTSSLLGHRLNKTDCRALTKELKPKMQEIWERAEVLDEGSRRIQLGALSKILRAGA